MPPDQVASAKAPDSLSSKVIWAPVATSTNWTPITSLHSFKASRARFCPAGVRAVRLTVSEPPWLTLKWWSEPPQ